MVCDNYSQERVLIEHIKEKFLVNDSKGLTEFVEKNLQDYYDNSWIIIAECFASLNYEIEKENFEMDKCFESLLILFNFLDDIDKAMILETYLKSVNNFICLYFIARLMYYFKEVIFKRAQSKFIPSDLQIVLSENLTFPTEFEEFALGSILQCLEMLGSIPNKPDYSQIILICLALSFSSENLFRIEREIHKLEFSFARTADSELKRLVKLNITSSSIPSQLIPRVFSVKKVTLDFISSMVSLDVSSLGNVKWFDLQTYSLRFVNFLVTQLKEISPDYLITWDDWQCNNLMDIFGLLYKFAQQDISGPEFPQIIKSSLEAMKRLVTKSEKRARERIFLHLFSERMNVEHSGVRSYLIVMLKDEYHTTLNGLNSEDLDNLMLVNQLKDKIFTFPNRNLPNPEVLDDNQAWLSSSLNFLLYLLYRDKTCSLTQRILSLIRKDLDHQFLSPLSSQIEKTVKSLNEELNSEEKTKSMQKRECQSQLFKIHLLKDTLTKVQYLLQNKD